MKSTCVKLTYNAQTAELAFSLLIFADQERETPLVFTDLSTPGLLATGKLAGNHL